MKLNSIHTIESAKATYGAAKSPSLSNLTPLTKDEQNLIQEQFPQGANRRLELYLADGNARFEQPESKGRNLDFRI